MPRISLHRLSLLAICILLSLASTLAQVSSLENTREYLERLLNERLEDGLIDETSLQVALERIDELLLEPLDINRASAVELGDLVLLSPYQIYQLLLYRTNQGGQIASLYDLKTIEGWDEATLRLIAPLLSCTPPDGAPYRAHESSDGRTSIALNTQHHLDKEVPKDYLGSGNAVALRWSYRRGQLFSAFLGAKQDAYEPWRYGPHRGFDAYAGHLQLDRWGLVNRAIVGDYRIHWGEGLIINQGFRLRAPYWQGYRRLGVRPVSSLAESSKSRGLAVELGSEKLQLSLAYSSRKLDGRINDEGNIYGLSEQGLHRTEQDWERRRQIPLYTWGGRISYRQSRWSIALQAVSTSFGHYRLARASGAREIEALEHIGPHRMASLSYRWQTRSARLRLWGEIARAERGGWAGVQMMQYRSRYWGEVQAGARYISPTYWAYHAQSHTHRLRPNNEAGISLNYRTKELLPRTHLELAADWYRDSSSLEERAGRVLISSLETSLGHWSLRMALSHKREEKHENRLRLGLHIAYQSGHWKTASGISISRVGERRGRMGYTRINYAPTPNLTLWASIALVNTDHWEARLYLAEPRLRYEYGFLMLSGQGGRLALGSRIRFGSRWSVELKALHQWGQKSTQAHRALSTHLSYRL
ncbi:MAG: hypothetical protein Q4A64_04710 [Porphyromonadaceae bacterium]|nr:hypothetical protein [Porphyromonadaceae bacterium]